MSRARAIEADHLDMQIVKAIDMACLLGTNQFMLDYPDEIEPFIQSDITGAHASVKKMLEMMQDRESEDAHEWLYAHSIFGVLMEIRTAVRKHSSQNQYRSISGWYVGWVYGDTYDVAWEQAKNWAESRHAADLEKFMKGGAASARNTTASNASTNS
jgi:hypothetical protein